MLFLIEYDRGRGEVVTIQEFDESDRRAAERVRLERELQLNNGERQREVVLMEAANEEALRRTHRRYFENLSQLVNAS